MNRRSLSIIPLALPLVGVLLAASAQAATPGAIPGKSGVPAAAPAASADTSKVPVGPMAVLKKYKQVTSSGLVDAANAQTSGSVSCPTNYVVVGGGAVIAGSSLSENLNGSVPFSSSSWGVYVNNSSGTAGSFTVYAVCVKKVKGYAIVSGTGVTNPSGAQTSATVTCPSGTVPLGGGGVGSSTSPLANLNTSIPISNGWRVDVNNASAASETATAYAVCGKAPTGYTQVFSSTPTTVNANSQAGNSVACPSGTLVFGGGAFSSSGSTSVNLNSSAPSGNAAWIAYENNATTGTTNLTAYAVCGQATP